jgi:hypothetical protein
MKLYRQLQMQPDQRAFMAERWRSWCRRRYGLDHQLSTALQQMQACPPSPRIHSICIIHSMKISKGDSFNIAPEMCAVARETYCAQQVEQCVLLACLC